MGKRGIFGFLLAAILFSTAAFAEQNVANTSQKGSLLIFPRIDVRVEGDLSNDTVIDISNDSNIAVYLNCNYINDHKGRVDFHFYLSPKGTISWDVLNHRGTISPPPFPASGSFSQGDAELGELICFAVDGAGANQIRFNHLTGVATVTELDTGALQTKHAFKYNAWAFTARSNPGVPPPPDGTPVGTGGDLQLTGGGLGTYDACPLYLIANFSPGGLSTTGGANVLGPVTYIDNDLAISSCNQDLRQDFTINLTKLRFEVWNEGEEEFTGAYQCADSVLAFGLDNPADRVPVNSGLDNFTFGTLETHNARMEIDGISSTQCPGSIASGLVGVLTTSIGVGTTPGLTIEGEDAEIGNTIHGAGAESGFVLWDPASSIVPEKPGRR
jgi:hypothetical protein